MQFYNIGRIYYNNKYIPISSLFIKIYKNDIIGYVYELVSTKNKDFVLFSNNTYELNNKEFETLVNFKSSTLFKNLYIDNDLSKDYIIDINTSDKFELFLKYLRNYDGKLYDFINELNGDTNE